MGNKDIPAKMAIPHQEILETMESFPTHLRTTIHQFSPTSMGPPTHTQVTTPSSLNTTNPPSKVISIAKTQWLVIQKINDGLNSG